MGGLSSRRTSSTGGKNGAGSGGSTGGDANHPVPRAGTEYEDDNVTRLPVSDRLSAIRSARRLAAQLQARTGRGATRLVTQSGITPYTASLMGSTQ